MPRCFGTGAYVCGMPIVHLGVPWSVGDRRSASPGGLVAVLIGALAIRTRGIYFAMVTLALSQCVYYVFYQATSLTGGENGLRGVNVPAIDVFGLRLELRSIRVKYYFMLAFVIAALWVLSRILASPFGAVHRGGARERARARASGYDVNARKLLTFVLSGLFCGLAGALSAIHLSIVPIDMLHYDTSGQVVMMSLLGGMGTFFGPFVGAAVFLLLEDLRDAWTVHWQLVVGPSSCCCVLFFPRGIWGSLLAWVEPMTTPDPPILEDDAAWRKRFGGFTALADISGASPRGSSRRSSARTAPARAPTSTCCPAPSRRATGACASRAATSPACRSTASRIWASPSPSRSPTCFPQLTRARTSASPCRR